MNIEQKQSVYYIAKKEYGKRLGAFFPNDLPNRTKNGVGFKDIICFSYDEYIIYRSYEEAKQYKEYMLKAIKGRADEYNKIDRNAYEKLFKKIQELEIFSESY